MRKRARLRIYPDKILFAKCKAVCAGSNINQIKRDMLNLLMGSKTGVGISAPQAGYPSRIILIGRDLFMVNPEITRRSWRKSTGTEGCLSCPGVYKKVRRYKKITVRYLDDNFSPVKNTFYGIRARIIQHEMDHLKGKCVCGGQK